MILPKRFQRRIIKQFQQLIDPRAGATSAAPDLLVTRSISPMLRLSSISNTSREGLVNFVSDRLPGLSTNKTSAAIESNLKLVSSNPDGRLRSTESFR